MKHICFEEKPCIGCTACSTVCPVNAISMVLNEEGFYEPHVDEKKCVECGKCILSCPMRKEYADVNPIQLWAGWNNSSKEKAQSTSGGIFTGLANVVLEKHGIAFGAVYASDNKSVYHANTDQEPLIKLQKSKYVVSNLNDCFKQIIDLKKSKRPVLFVGTPCQCAGLRSVIGDNDNNITIVDFICGGTPSAKAFREYVEYREQKSGSAVKNIDFRGKDTGWKKQYLRIEYENGKIENTFYLYDPYFSIFCIEHLSTRRECSYCRFRKCHQSDITIADFWGYKGTEVPDDDTGISFIAINTKRGEKIFEEFSAKTVFPITAEACSYAFSPFPANEQQDKRKDTFLKELSTNCFPLIMKKYTQTGYFSVFLRRVRSKLGV